jgi:hypothetical protein
LRRVQELPMKIAPGSTITVEVTATPTTAAAEKTLIRLYNKDAAIKRANRARKNRRPSWQTWRRGGRFWHHQMKSESAAEVTKGAKFTLRATLDVLRDLGSVERFVKCTPAK